MKKTFEAIGIITLLIGSFMYKEEVSMTAKLSDNLLEEIKTKSINYKIKPIESIITNDTIIPGINGREVDIKKSYNKMKEIGYFNEKLLEYNKIIVKNPLKQNKDKYIISGNKNKKEIALIFKVTKEINSIIKTLNKNNIKATIFVDSAYLEKHHDYIINLIKKGYTIGNLSKNEDYTHPDFIWMKTIIINTGYQKNNYCLTNKKNKKTIKNCQIEDSYTILATPLKNPFIDIKKSLSNGGIYVINTNNQSSNELENIIKYIKSKGYIIEPLETLLKE